MTRASKPSMLSRLSRSYTHTSSISCAHTCQEAPHIRGYAGKLATMEFA